MVWPIDSGGTMYSDQDDIACGVRMAVVAVISAIVTATIVISAGEAWLSRVSSNDRSPAPTLIRTSG